MPKIRVYIPNAKSWPLATQVDACCNNPAPTTEHRVFSGNTTHQRLYCASCDTEWMEFAWKTREVEAIERGET